jgi:hypothetical protein
MGNYATILQHWIKTLGRERICILLYDDIARHSTRILKTVAGFFKQDILRANRYAGIRVNSAEGYRLSVFGPVFRAAAVPLRTMGATGLIHRLKQSAIVSLLQKPPGRNHRFSKDESDYLDSLRSLYRSEVTGLATLINDPALIERWGYN